MDMDRYTLMMVATTKVTSITTKSMEKEHITTLIRKHTQECGNTTRNAVKE